MLIEKKWGYNPHNEFLIRDTLRYNEGPLTLHHPRDAKRNGIHTVYQEVDQNLVGYLSVAENVFLDTIESEKRLVPESISVNSAP